MKKETVLLKDLLEEKSNERVCLGTDSGTNWIWIGTGEEMLARLPKMDDYFKDFFENEIVKKRDEANLYLRDIRLIHNHTDIELLRLLENASRLLRIVCKYKSYLGSYVNFEDRPVLQCVENIGENGWLIKVSGMERGDLWWKDEKPTVFD